MLEIFDLIKKCIALIEENSGSDVIIYDFYGAFYKTELSELPQLDRWHLKKYCLYVKENPQIFRKCVDLKHRFYDKVFSGGEIIKSTCFCGVSEYAVPINVNGIKVGIVSATGFKGDMPISRGNRLAKRLGLSAEELDALRQAELIGEEKEAEVKSLLELLAYLLNEYIIKNELLLTDNLKGNSYVRKALEYIDRNFTKDLSVSLVANECYISVPYLQALFSKAIGHGVAEEIRSRRIKYAKELLATTEYSVKYIAFECGFDSADYFSSVFKRECGITPLNFRSHNHRLSL